MSRNPLCTEGPFQEVQFVHKDHFNIYFRLKERFENFIMCINDRYHAVQYTVDLNISVPNSLQNISAIPS